MKRLFIIHYAVRDAEDGEVVLRSFSDIEVSGDAEAAIKKFKQEMKGDLFYRGRIIYVVAIIPAVFE